MDLTSALNNGNNRGGLGNFNTAVPAEDPYKPIPGGRYLAVIVRGEICVTRAGDDGYRIRFKISEGEHAGRLQFKTYSLSSKCISYTKRDLMPFGLTSDDRLLRPFPEAGKEYHVRLTVALQRGDDNREFNDVKRVELLRVTESPVSEFVIPTQTTEGGGRP